MIYDLQLQKTVVLRMQPRRQATLTQPLQCVSRHPVASPCNIHAANTMRFAASRGQPACIYTHGNTRWQQSCSHSTAICNSDSKTPCNYARASTPKATLCHRYSAAKKRRKRTAAAPAAHRRYLSSPPATTLHGKTHGFVLRLPPQNKADKAHATFMQPLQFVLQHHVANPHVSTHMATPDDNNHVAIPLRSATQIPKHPVTTHAQAHPKLLCATVTVRQKKDANGPQPHPPHTGGTFHRRLQPLYTEKDMVLCSGFLPKTKPMQHSCSHYNAFSNITWLTRM